MPPIFVSPDLLAFLLNQAMEWKHPETRIPESSATLESKVNFLQKSLQEDNDLRTLTGSSPGMRQVRAAIQQVARTDSTVLITGETGTGKELVARAIHQLSPRRERLLVPLNCAALPPALLPSELFGHEAGAFTGALKRRIGRFELAHQGTLFLDEIGELAPETPVALLRVLQERVIERLGGGKAIPMDVRIVAATHQDLSSLVGSGKFRSDLYFRLNVFPIQVPPLRNRREDIPDLVQHFLHVFNRRMNKAVNQVQPHSLTALLHYPWPGNVRELENLIERAMILATGNTLRVDPTWLEPPTQPKEWVQGTLSGTEKRLIENALERCAGKIYGPHGAAALLGLKPTTLYGKMQRHGIPRIKGPSGNTE